MRNRVTVNSPHDNIPHLLITYFASVVRRDIKTQRSQKRQKMNSSWIQAYIGYDQFGSTKQRGGSYKECRRRYVARNLHLLRIEFSWTRLSNCSIRLCDWNSKPRE